MKAVEFDTFLTDEGKIALPAECQGDVPAGQQLRVVVMWEAVAADEAWRSTGRLRFAEAYSVEDVVYEQLMHEAPNR